MGRSGLPDTGTCRLAKLRRSGSHSNAPDAIRPAFCLVRTFRLLTAVLGYVSVAGLLGELAGQTHYDRATQALARQQQDVAAEEFLSPEFRFSVHPGTSQNSLAIEQQHLRCQIVLEMNRDAVAYEFPAGNGRGLLPIAEGDVIRAV